MAFLAHSVLVPGTKSSVDSTTCFHPIWRLAESCHPSSHLNWAFLPVGRLGSSPILSVWFHTYSLHLPLTLKFAFFCRSWLLTSKKEIHVPRGNFPLHPATHLHLEFRQVWRGRRDARTRWWHGSAALLSGGLVFLNLENVVIDLSSLLYSSSRGLLENRLGQTAVWWQQDWVHLPQYSHAGSPIALLLQGWKLPSKHPPPLPLRFALKFPIVCLLQPNASSLVQKVINLFF